MLKQIKIKLSMHFLPGSVAETMAPKKRQSVKKKSPPSCPTTFMKDTKPYMTSLRREKEVEGNLLHSIITSQQISL